MSSEDNDIFAAPPLFSTYKTGENRVTSTLTALLHFLPLAVGNALVSGLFEDDQYALVTISDQSKGDGNSVPDARITPTPEILIEVKIKNDSIDNTQLKGHLAQIKNTRKVLLYLTPDKEIPATLKSKSRLHWANFQSLDALLEKFLLSNDPLIGERERFLILNFRRMLADEGLLAPEKDTCIVAASSAWRIYKDYGIYACQPNRTFRKVEWLGFYYNGHIQPILARVEDGCVYDNALVSDQDGSLLLTSGGEKVDIPSGREVDLRGFISHLGGPDKFNHKIFFLPSKSDPKVHRKADPNVDLSKARILNLERCIQNDLQNKDGHGYAFTQGQRYCKLKDLKSAKTTSDLVD